MKNSFFKLVIGLVATGSVALAEGAFMGVEGAYAFISKLKYTSSAKDSQSAIGAKAGYDFDMFRAYGSYHYAFEAKDRGVKWNSHKFLLNADYTPTLADNLKLILGGYTGISALKIKTTNNDSGSDMVFGLRLGIECGLDSKSAIEAGFKADKTKYDVDHGEYLTEKNTGFYLGYNYKF
ncbi:MAG: outer membrane beta-barrel protein [Campylobacter sp.]